MVGMKKMISSCCVIKTSRRNSTISQTIFIFRYKQQEIVSLENQIQQKIDTQKKAGVDLDSTCQICLKTKFADGIGHLCNYCNVRCCARCGGKVALRSNKVSFYSCLTSFVYNVIAKAMIFRVIKILSI